MAHRICMYCKDVLGPFPGPNDSHGICHGCFRTHHPDVEFGFSFRVVAREMLYAWKERLKRKLAAASIRLFKRG